MRIAGGAGGDGGGAEVGFFGVAAEHLGGGQEGGLSSIGVQLYEWDIECDVM